MGAIEVGLAALSKKFITPEQLEEALLLHQKLSGMKLQEDIGEILVKKGWITRQRLTGLRNTMAKTVAGPIPGYEVMEFIGRGGMGMVFKARQMIGERVVAVKCTMPDFANDDGIVERFVREARILASLHHPNIVECVDAGCHNGIFYYVMEYVEGTSLKRLLAEKGKLECASAVKLVKQAALALDHASQFGIVHRDIKPDNLLLTRDNTVKLTDMGVAKMVNRSAPAESESYELTRSGAVVGTIAYMSPEQAEGDQDVDGRSDIYSLGLTFYAMLAGQPPFQDDNPVTALNLRLRKDVPVHKLKGAAPEPVLAILRKMTMRDRAQRYQTARSLAADLDAFESGSTALELGLPPIVSKASTRRFQKTQVQPPAALSPMPQPIPVAPPPPPSPRHTRLFIGIAVVVIGALLAGMYFLIPNQNGINKTPLKIKPELVSSDDLDERAALIWEAAQDFEKNAARLPEEVLLNYQMARDKTLGTKFFLKIQDRIDALQAQLSEAMAKDGKTLSDKQELLVRDRRFAEARELINQERGRYKAASWKSMVDAHSNALEAKLLEAFHWFKREAFNQCKRARFDEGRLMLQGLKAWKLPDVDVLTEKALGEYDTLQREIESRARAENDSYAALESRVAALVGQKKYDDALKQLESFEKDVLQDSLRKEIQDKIREIQAAAGRRN